MAAELRSDKVAGRRDSAGRRLVEGLFTGAAFTEIGRLIGVMPRPQGSAEDEADGLDRTEDRIPGEVVAGWGEVNGRIIFAVADEALEPAPRNPAAAAVAWNVTAEALRCGAPLVSFPAATRTREDLRSAASFMRTGVQLDLAQEQIAAAAIPKIVALAGTVDLPVALEMTMAHYVIAGPGSEVLLPDGTSVATARLGDLGWADLTCATEEETLATVRAFLGLLPGTDNSAPAINISQACHNAAAAELESLIFDPASTCTFSTQATGSLLAGIGRIGGRVAGVAYGAVGSQADQVRLEKLLLVCSSFGLPLTVLADGTASERLDIPADVLAGLNSVLIIAGPELAPAMISDPSLYDVVLAWHDRPEIRPDAVIDPDSTRELVASALADLAVGRTREQRPPLQPAATSGWRPR
jgi:acetyl-CoA carboxylase carboxyltransferase component